MRNGRVRGKVKGRAMKLRFIAALMNHTPPIIKRVRVTNSLYAIKFREEEKKGGEEKKNTLLMIASDIYRIWKRFPGESFIVSYDGEQLEMQYASFRIILYTM